MTLTKLQRKRMAALATRAKAQDRINECVLATGSLDSAKICLPPADVYGKPELGNWRLEISPGESMAIFDRLLLRNRMRLDALCAVVMDEFGGDFSTECFESERSLLVVPIGHERQDLWPGARSLKRSFSVGTDGGSLAFLCTSHVRKSLLHLGTIWDCLPGRYSFYYEEIVDLGALKQPQARNVIVSRSPETDVGVGTGTDSKGGWLWSRQR